jgi:hypothetical protein
VRPRWTSSAAGTVSDLTADPKSEGGSMKRFHVHVSVSDLSKSIAFYSAMFGSEPTIVKTDYAKWMLEDPRVNFAISNRGQTPGVNHLGLQAEDEAELDAIHANLRNADASITPEKGAHCCYAVSDKYWVTDPQGIAWESFHSLDSIPVYGPDQAAATSGSCCGPRPI